MHEAVAFRRERITVAQKRAVVSGAEGQGIGAADRQRALFLIRPLLLLHLQLCDSVRRAVDAQSDLAAQLDALDLVPEILVVQRVEIKRANAVAPGTVVRICVHHLRQTRPQHSPLRHIQRVFFLLAHHLVHAASSFLRR